MARSLRTYAVSHHAVDRMRERLRKTHYGVEVTDDQLRDIVDSESTRALEAGRCESVVDRGVDATVLHLESDMFALVKRNLFRTSEDPQESAVVTLLQPAQAFKSLTNGKWTRVGKKVFRMPKKEAG